jgi:hypothetical protein
MRGLMLEATVDSQKLSELKELFPLHSIPIVSNECPQSGSLISEALASHLALTNNSLYSESPLFSQSIPTFKGLTRDFFDKSLGYPTNKPIAN